jgi:S1-C subfamily serine protease
VTEILDAGLGRFLQRVEVEPELESGSFVGFRIVELRPLDWWQGVDLAVGDVVTQVNGMPVEQPTEAHAAFESLRSASHVKVSYTRAGEARELAYSIVDRTAAAPAAPTSAP